MNRSVLIRHALVLTQNARRERVFCDVRVRDGRIVEMAPALGTDDPNEKVIDAAGKWMIPGLVQAHVHLTQTLFRGLADDRELLPWLRERIWPLEAAHTAETNRASAELGIAELLLTGTTTILDMGTTHHHDEVFAAADRMGIGYVGGKAMMDQGEGVPARLLEDTAASLAESDALREKWHGHDHGRIRYAYAPRFILSCSDKLLREVSARSEQYDCLIHTHANENRGELAAVQALLGSANLAALQARGCLNERSVIAHAVWVDGEEEETLVRSGAAVCHCPGSNLKLASGVMPLQRLRARGVRVGLGADGAPCNNTLDQFFEMRLCGLVHRPQNGAASLPAQTVFDLATIEGARALRLQDEIGSVEVGKRADFALLSPGLAATPHEDPVAALVYAAHGGWVTDVFVQGQHLVANSSLVGVDVKAVGAAANQARQIVRRVLTM